MKRFLGRCFGGPGKRKLRREAEEVRERPESGEGQEEAPVLRYPLFDPRNVKTKNVNLSRAPLEKQDSTSLDVPRELATREVITLPADQEEEEAAQLVPAELDAANSLPEETEVAQPLPEETIAAQPSPEEPPAAVPPAEEQQPAQEEAPEALPVEKENKDLGKVEAPVEEKRITSRVPAAPQPAAKNLVFNPTRDPQAAASVPEEEPPQKAAAAAHPAKASRPSPPRAAPLPKKEPSSVKSEASSSTAAQRAAVPARETAVVEALKLPEMSPLEKLNSAREEKPLLNGPDGFGDDEADTAPCTPRESERRPDQQLAELRRKLTRQMQALEELQRTSDDEKLVQRLYHDRSRRKRKQRMKSKRKTRVAWSYVQAAIDCYTEVQDAALEDFRMYLDAHPPADCRICRNFDFSDVPLL